MSHLAALLKEFYERSSYKSIAALAEAAQEYAPLSDSYLKRMLRGSRYNPGYDKVMAVAQALALSVDDTNRLLEAAGFAASPAVEPTASTNPYFSQISEAFTRLAQTPGLPAETLRLAAQTAVLMLDGYRLAHTAAAAPELGAVNLKAETAGTPVASTLRILPSAALTPEEGLIDDLLGEILARQEDQPLDMLFESLAEAARQDRWEIKRRITEALPRLVQLQPDETLRLAEILRSDYHPDYRADIRRRVIEAVPVLHRFRPEAALQLLIYRPQDEVYMAMATVEVLHDLENQALISAAAAQPYLAALRLENPVHQEVVGYLRQLLAESRHHPDAALASMNANRAHPERIFRICIQRVAPRLLQSRPEVSLELMAYFLRKNADGAPAEHQNLRRPVSRALPEVLNLLPNGSEQISQKIRLMLQALAEDPDIHVRRALGDTLDRLVSLNVELGVMVLDKLIQDTDPYVRQRAWRTLLQLADLYPDKANDYYAQLLTKSWSKT